MSFSYLDHDRNTDSVNDSTSLLGILDAAHVELLLGNAFVLVVNSNAVCGTERRKKKEKKKKKKGLLRLPPLQGMQGTLALWAKMVEAT